MSCDADALFPHHNFISTICLPNIATSICLLIYSLKYMVPWNGGLDFCDKEGNINPSIKYTYVHIWVADFGLDKEEKLTSRKS